MTVDSTITIRSRVPRASGTAAVGIVCLVLFSRIGTAEEASELGKLIFEPVLLSSATAAPIDLNRSPTIDRQALSKAILQYRGAIESLKRARSSNSELVAQLGLIAVAYQGLDRHEEAVEALEEAISLTVQDGGRNNLEQIPLQEQKLPSYRALEDIDAVDDTEELIYSLKEKTFSPGSREMYYATINLADWNTTAYYKENYGAGHKFLKRQRAVIPRVQRCIRIPGTSPGEGASECQANPIFTGDIKDVSEQDINDARLRKIDRLYADYQKALLDGGNVQLDTLVDIARRVARLAFATKQEMDFERDNYTYDPNYDGSREQAIRNSSQRMDESYLTGEKALKYAINLPRSFTGFRPEALAAAFLDLGDWHLAYGKAAAAEEAYGEAYQVLLDAGFSSENIDRGLATDMPIQIPVFATHLYTRRSTGVRADAELVFRGYIDLSYTVDALGNARDLRFIGRSSDDSSEIERLIELQLKSMKFRPVLSGGKLISPGQIEARYYYSY